MITLRNVFPLIFADCTVPIISATTKTASSFHLIKICEMKKIINIFYIL